MSTYLNTIVIGLLIFVFLFYFIMLFTWLIQYRRNGRFEIKEGVIFLSFIFYIEVAYFMTILPLPEISAMSTTVKPIVDYMQLNPLYFITDAAEYFQKHGLSLIGFIKAPPVYVTLFNILLLFPLGVYLRKLFRQPMIKVIIISFLVSLSFEMLQLSGLLFIYPYPYRLFDVCDLMMNTLGGFLGGLFANYFGLLFSKNKENKVKETYFEVTKFKQFIIYLADLTIIFVLYIFSGIFAGFVMMLKDLSLTSGYSRDNVFMVAFAMCMIVFIFIPILRRQHQTISMIIADVHLERKKDHFWLRFVRTLIFYGPFIFSLFGWIDPFGAYITIAYMIYFIIHFFIFKKGMNIIDKILGYTLKRNYDLKEKIGYQE